MFAKSRSILLLALLASLTVGAAACAPAAKASKAAKAGKAKVYEHVELGPETLSFLVQSTSLGCTASCSNGGSTPLTCSASGSKADCEQSKDGRTASCSDDDGTIFCDCNANPPACSTTV